MTAMDSFEASGFAEFDRLALLFRRTRELLDAASTTGELPDGGTEVLANETLPHVEDIEQGFRVWLRTGATGLSELRTLVARAGVRAHEAHTVAEHRAALIETMHEMAATAARPEIVPASRRALAALEHARLVFAMLPSTPADQVHYPAGLRTYADIFPPRGPAELAERIEELERNLWAVATRRAARVTDNGYRRTYGFFDTAARISGAGFASA
jgi:hypothetical protein